MMEDIKYIIESLLFVADEPLTTDRLKKILIQVEKAEIRQAMAELTAEYEARGGGFYLDEVAGGFQIRTRPKYTDWIKKLIQPKPLRLSRPALETLVIIAYKQPIIRSDIEHLRGVDCGGVIRVLLERKLIRVLGRKEIAGRPLIYATTKRFLEIFDLKNLRDLPTPKEIEELAKATNEGNQAIIVDSTSETEDVLQSSSESDPNDEDAFQEPTKSDQPLDNGMAKDNLRIVRKNQSAGDPPEKSDEGS
ncbi:MAG: SMC-Scp complex subunit ScpB [Desulfobacterales bacterium]|jgi:segregation and condensation protein B